MRPGLAIAGAACLSAGAFSAAPALAASGGGEQGPDLGLLLLQVLNTAVLLFILVRFAGRPIRNFLIQRSHGIRSAIETSEARLKEAQAQVNELQLRLERFEREAAEILAEADANAEAERARAGERARAISDRIREDAERLADQEIERARRELRAEAAELAASIARDLLRENLGPEDDRRLVDEYIERVEEVR